MKEHHYRVQVYEVPKKETDPVAYVLRLLSGKDQSGRRVEHPREQVIDVSSILKPARLTEEGIMSWYQATQAGKRYHFGVPDSKAEEARKLARDYTSSIESVFDRPIIDIWDRTGIRNVISNRRSSNTGRA